MRRMKTALARSATKHQLNFSQWQRCSFIEYSNSVRIVFFVVDFQLFVLLAHTCIGQFVDSFDCISYLWLNMCERVRVSLSLSVCECEFLCHSLSAHLSLLVDWCCYLLFCFASIFAVSLHVLAVYIQGFDFNFDSGALSNGKYNYQLHANQFVSVQICFCLSYFNLAQRVWNTTHHTSIQ